MGDSDRIRFDHPLRRLFTELVGRRFFDDVRLQDFELVRYTADLLTDFADARRLYWLRDASGRALDDVGEMLLESHPLLAPRGSFDRERAIRKHIGDFTLFMAGLFPESIARHRRRGSLRLDAFVDYIQAGKESYAIVSSYDQLEYQHEAPLFRKLSEQFELCVFGLNLVKGDLERLRHTAYERMRQALEPRLIL
jgi:hypothetical protein